MILRQCRKGWLSAVSIILVLGVMAGCSGNAGQESASQTTQPAGNSSGTKQTEVQDQQPKQGGTIKVAVDADPPTLDWMSSPASATTVIAYHMFEQLFSLDKDLSVKPMLAKDYTVSSDQKTYEIVLREGVKFHDGSTMNAEDVVASLKRWGALSGLGRHLFKKVADVKATGEYKVQIVLKEAYSPVINNLADPSQAMAVIPAEIAKAADKLPLENEQLIGTGPLKFDSWKRGQQITLKRFEDYTPREEDWGGLAGKKVAYADMVQFDIVKDAQVRLDGMRTGQYDYAVRIPKDYYDQLKDSTEMKPVVTKPDSWITVVPDKSEPPFNDVRLRQAINYAIDREKIGLATYGSPEFFERDGSIFFPDQKDLYTKEGTQPYEVFDPEKAKALMKEAGYKGEPIRLVATNSFDDHHNSAQVLMQELKDVGFNVDLQLYEWATFLNTVNTPSNFDLFVTGFPPVFDVTGLLWIDPSFPGWYDSPKMVALVDQWSKTTDAAEQKRLLGDLNKTFYEELPVVKFINEIGLEAAGNKLQGFQSWLQPRFWNVGVSASSY